MQAEGLTTSFADPPFACPPDIVIDVPVPPSLNKARRIDWAQYPSVKNWQANADKLLMFTKQVRGKKKIMGRYQLKIIVSEAATGCDLGNLEKIATDYLVRIEMVMNDSPKYLRRLIIEFGEAPEGVRLVLSEMA